MQLSSVRSVITCNKNLEPVCSYYNYINLLGNSISVRLFGYSEDTAQNATAEDDLSDWPDVWDTEKIAEKKAQYPWLIASKGKLGCTYCITVPVPKVTRTQGTGPSKEWCSTSVGFDRDSEKSRSAKLTSLRKKIGNHEKSISHVKSAKALKSKNSKTSETQGLLNEKWKVYLKSTENVFRLAYCLAKIDRPYSDFPHLIDCHRMNGADMGVTLHSEKSCQNMICTMATEMKTRLCKSIVEHKMKFSVMVDESTSVATKSCLVVHLKVFMKGRPTDIFLDLVEIANAEAKTICAAILKTLDNYGLDGEFRQENFISFASDGASNMIGHKSGVSAVLLSEYPNLILWHCANHRLELSVGDVANEVTGVNSFKVFMDSLYALYSQSPKNQEQLKECAADLEVQLRKIGRILDTRWAASSLLSAKAVWQSYPALAAHFAQPHGSQQAKYDGLLNSITSPNFLKNLAAMLDALTEVSSLSLALQNRQTGLIESHHLIQQSICSFEKMTDEPGKYLTEANTAIASGEFKGVELSGSLRVVAIKPVQFFRSLSANLKTRLLTVACRKGQRVAETEKNTSAYSDLMSQVKLLSYVHWPTDYDVTPRFGEEEIGALSRRFGINPEESVAGFRLFKAVGGKEMNDDLAPLAETVKVIPVSTAECERSFSSMNNIATKKRNKLTVENIAALMFISIMGPPLNEFNPTSYSILWLNRGHHSANSMTTKKRKRDQNQGPFSHLHEMLA